MADTKTVKNMLAKRRQRRGQRGAVAVTSILFLTLIIGGSLGAIDLARHNVAQLRMTNALDAAVISAGRNLGNYTPESNVYVNDQWVSDAHAFFHANMSDAFLGTEFSDDALDIQYEELLSDGDVGHRIGQKIAMSVQAELPLISFGYLKIPTMKLAAANEALRRNRSDLEVVLVMDNSGSMDTRDTGSRKTRIAHLKEAAHLLIDMILGAAKANDNSRTFIGLVPFTSIVNVKNTAITREWLTPGWKNSPFVTSGVWKGCITEPRPVNNRPLADVAPANNGPGYFKPLYWERSSDKSVSNNPHSRVDILNATFEPTLSGFRQPRSYEQPSGTGYRVPTRKDHRQLTLYYQMNHVRCYTNQAVHFLSEDQNSLKDTIDDLEVGGGTAVPVGLLWGWRMLHPTWSGHWGNHTVAVEEGPPVTMPRPPHRDLTKVLILLTDGANSVQGNATRTLDEGFNYTGTYVDNNGRNRNFNGSLGYDSVTVSGNNRHNSLNDEAAQLTPDGGESTARLDTFTRQLCNNIKNPDDPHVPGGIKVYTIALGPASDAGLMRDCASQNGFYDASNVNDLSAAFASIAGDLMELRLTK